MANQQNPADPIKLYGTAQEPAPPVILTAGPLTAELDAGNLRHVRYGGIEIIRAVSFIVRDRNWGTYDPLITELRVEAAAGAFSVHYQATARDREQSFRYRATITGGPDGLSFAADGVAETGFLTNRTGFVVLHPIEGVAGHPVEIEHVDGTLENGRFPELIDPVQPMMNLRTLTHQAAPGLRVSCRMDGDTFEMEDQRNWTDASYKTYVRPLALPWPYQLPAGTDLEQSVTIRVSGAAPRAAAGDRPITVSPGPARGVAPQIGLGLDPDNLAGTRSRIAELARAGVQHLICHHDPRRGHDSATLRAAADVAAALGAAPWLEAVIASVEGFADEIAALGRAAAELGSPFPVVLVSPAADLKCTLPGSAWPPAPPPVELFRAARNAFPQARIGGGMFSFFTELNRKRPPVAELDLVSFTTSALVHAGDDHSAMEGLESLPAIAASARAIAGDRPLAVGPSALGMRMNPYGAAPMANPDNIRQAMNHNDPRQRGLLGAAWAVGYHARMASSVSALALGGTTGAFGLVHTPEPWPAPWYDEHGGLYPCFHVIRALAAMAGQPLLAVALSDPAAVQAVAVARAGGADLLLANLTPQPRRIELPHPPTGVALLDAAGFAEAARTPDFLDRLAPPATGATLALGAFAVARLRL